MAMIKIQEKQYAYDEAAIFNFSEGLIGLPEMRRAVLIPLEDCAPFCWLASVDDEKYRFIVVNPREIFAGYQPAAPSPLDETAAEVETLAIVKICSDWTQTTVNLRAPIFINPATRHAVQTVLSDSHYRLAELLPLD